MYYVIIRPLMNSLYVIKCASGLVRVLFSSKENNTQYFGILSTAVHRLKFTPHWHGILSSRPNALSFVMDMQQAPAICSRRCDAALHKGEWHFYSHLNLSATLISWCD